MKLPKAPDALDAEMLADLAFLDAFAAAQMETVSKSQETAPQRIFDQTWVGEDDKLYFDFEVIGTGMSLREWEAAQ